MSTIIWMSDLHFAADGLVLGLDPRAHLRAAVDQINAHYSDADLCVISGDMVNRGTAEDYAALAVELQRLTIPYAPMVGNHDDRAEMKRALAVPGDAMSGFVQYGVALGSALLLCLDTLTPGSDGGSFCQNRLAWLTEQFSDHSGTPTYVFMHHPPLALGLPMQDLDGQRDAAALLDVLSVAQVKYLFLGHVHRPIAGNVRGIPFATMRSVLVQAPPPRPDWDWNSFVPANEAPAFGVIEIKGGAVVVQYVDVAV